MALCCAIHISQPASAGDDAQQIRALIGTTWDSPDSKVEIDPIVVSGAHAVASWTQGDKGGRALLRRGDNGWSVVLCSGDPLRDATWLQEAGVPKGDAERMASALATAEGQASADRRARFSLFEGVVSGDDASHHAPGEPTHERDH
ncbi:MAG: copper uptake system-associated protein [Hyphomicrobium sp.]